MLKRLYTEYEKVGNTRYAGGGSRSDDTTDDASYPSTDDGSFV
ncbi:hypothetical protein BN13_20052 [Nostocoides jenkinsii Ben 74]|uniref:Uncharacterized protein n=1 Tax=Nostocoides jenkinsii Ben 74 TaxID=1193518 RepID=A0A077MA61_9MICO|nr:hypothetical protein BN13_20052 [Tetrasphaera jenkinsii Ben 74]